jgi:hypothetical protein
MKIKESQLRTLIREGLIDYLIRAKDATVSNLNTHAAINEFKDTSYAGDYDTIDITGNLPPVAEPRRGGGGSNCDLGSPRFDRVYDVIFDNYFRWIEMKFPAEQPYTVDNNPINEYTAYLTDLGVDMTVFDNEMEMYEMLMTIMAFYVCKTGARLGDVFLDPRPALRLWSQQ